MSGCVASLQISHADLIFSLPESLPDVKTSWFAVKVGSRTWGFEKSTNLKVISVRAEMLLSWEGKLEVLRQIPLVPEQIKTRLGTMQTYVRTHPKTNISCSTSNWPFTFVVQTPT